MREQKTVTNLGFKQLHPITLRFRDAAQERAYGAYSEGFRQLQMRWALLMVGFLYIISSLLCLTWIAPLVPPWAYKLHLGQGIFYCLLTWILVQYVRSKAWLYGIILLTMTTSWTSHYLITFQGESTAYFSEVYFMLLWAWVISGLPYTLAARMNFLYLGVLEFLLYQSTAFSFEVLMVHQLFLLVAMTLGGFSGYLIEFHRRESFFNIQNALHAKQETEEAIQTKDRFFSIISHDLRGPVGSLSVLLNEVVTDPTEIDPPTFQRIQHTTKNLYSLVVQLLEWAKSQQGKLEMRPQHLALEAMVSACFNALQGQANQKNIELQSQGCQGVYVYADEASATTVLRNLVSNAIKYSQIGGRILVHCETGPEFVTILVQDWGVGITAEVQQKLFQPGEQIQSNMGTKQEEGSGLGLILCAEFVEQNGGQIGVESTPGIGSSFWFTLPLGQEADQTILSHLELAPLRVLVAEDNWLHQQSTAKALDNLGFTYQFVHNGQEALDQLEQSTFDLILMDIDMPIMNGLEASKRIRQKEGEQPLIFALSAYSREELNQFATDFTFPVYLNKPLNAEELAQRLRQHWKP